MNRINMQYYNGTDAYSDGEIEDVIFDIVSNNKLDIDEIIKKSNKWEILYHLSPLRRNLLEWINISEYNDALEVGSGCGALTGLLCENVSRVTGIELSKRRAEIVLKRCEKFNNLEMIVGNLLDIPLPAESFDLITLVGVLEYAGKFSEGNFPYESLLSYLFQLMQRNGKLVIAIENKFGLKYWAGAREDHTSRFFDSLENYNFNGSIRTFSKFELEDLLRKTGFNKISFYYPFPDYKLPTHIFSEDFLPTDGFFGDNSPNYDMDRVQLFNEPLVLDNLITNKQFSFFANSFLIICEKN
ncbi:class I SAM-dependent methyltransferase [Paenibacillus ihbetae]|uniref:SAM-dependent methyltransferase n=1 Tax=Paenibacillus ihbetae TaxID=1870820 RepID=A0ABX3K2M7_9BACL|nr:class I SAM-dependent methyltransferase [Paenibacillus ihbetae]OOC63690.1 SAM-dependent methyltransferase [Paenibacillus ihbetae]